MKKDIYEIRKVRQTYTTRGYDKDSVETHYVTEFHVYKNGKFVDGFHNKGGAIRFVKIQSPSGKRVLKKIEVLDKKILALEKRIEKLQGKALKLEESLKKEWKTFC